MEERRITKEEGKRVNISRFPNFLKFGSIRGMKKQYYDVAALLVRCGSYIYSVTSEPNFYYNDMFCLMLLLFGAVVFISGTDPKKLKDFINKNDQSDKF